VGFADGGDTGCVLQFNRDNPRVLLRVIAATLGLVFVTCALAGAADETPTAAAGDVPKQPHAHLTPTEDFYDPKAKRLNAEGRVLVAFDITPAGRAAKVSVLWTENELLVPSVEHLLADVRYDVPSDWATTGGMRRWRLGIVFRLMPGSQVSDEFAIPVLKVYVTGSRVGPPPHAPQRPDDAR